MQLGPFHLNAEISVADALVVLGATWAAALWIVSQIRQFVKRIDLHEKALIRAGWLVRNRHTGDLEVRGEYSSGR